MAAVAQEPAAPRGADLVGACGASLVEHEAEPPERTLGGGRDPCPIGGQRAQPIARGRGKGELQASAGCHEAGDPGRDRLVTADTATQQRAPREAHGDQVGGTDQRCRWRLGGGRDEQRIRQATAPRGPRSTPRRLGHRCRVGIETDRKGDRIRCGRRQDGAAITGPDIDRQPLEAGDEIGELADVHLEQATSFDDADHASRIRHAPSLGRHRPRAIRLTYRNPAERVWHSCHDADPGRALSTAKAIPIRERDIRRVNGPPRVNGPAGGRR
ncbi:MAG: hypothetical protein FIA92_18035 [Chloroflexi bacterium]|nr:hypothetical protein [Chloroflexota bacterium]